VKPVRETARANGRLLAGLKARGLQLGVVSNGCGNVDRLCDDLGLAFFRLSSTRGESACTSRIPRSSFTRRLVSVCLRLRS
jgi:hypothetical protein